MSITRTDHPPHPRQLESVLPQLGLVDRIAFRIAIRALARLEQRERTIDREQLRRRHELAIQNERRANDAERRSIFLRPPM